MKNICVFVLLSSPLTFYGQRADTSVAAINAPDTLQVIVTAFNSRAQWKSVPAAIAVLRSKDMERYGGTSMVPVLNIVPGVRMEERSPASYRLSFRGSLLRSPFGVRNVKVYWNDIPLTDAGGNTYLNLVDISQLTSAEVLKGPVASVYGAGTGGALLLRTTVPQDPQQKDHFDAALTGGSYGLFEENIAWRHSVGSLSSSVQQAHQQADGYRQQSASRKDVITWLGGWQGKKQRLNFLFFYTDLFYQTPGGLTLAQFQQDPKLSRQQAGAVPGSVQQKAAIYNKTIFAGIHHDVDFNERVSLSTFVTGNKTDFKNPFITNYEERNERNLGIGTNLTVHTGKLRWTSGTEWLYNHSNIDDYGNRSGVKDTVQFKDDVFAHQWFAFSQLQLTPGERWNITAGVSVNSQSYNFKRLTNPSTVYVKRRIAAMVTPRFALLYRLTNDVSAYAVIAKGFSPPALAEVRPSDGKFHGDLDAEYGWNYEAGIRGELADRRLQFDLAFYYFKLQSAIVRRNDSTGAEFFVNAGGATQQGVELMLKYQAISKSPRFVNNLSLWTSYSYQPYRFDSYQQTSFNYSGNALTGVPRNIWLLGGDLSFAGKAYLNASLNSTARLPLTDANDAYADAYHLVQVKLGYHAGGKWNVFAGMDNILNEVYSLGNDINAAGKRYYNPAAGRNVFAGIQVHW